MALAQKPIAAIEARKQKLIDAVVEKLVSKDVYDDQIAVVGTELATAHSQLSEVLIGADELQSVACLILQTGY